jgi:O-antigen/teichoic acid export membrane protein
MFQQLKRLGTDTAVYGLSTIIGRFLSFLLVPFYTNVLMPADYGISAYVYSLLAFMNVLYAYGMESAYFKYSASGEIGTPKEHFSTPFLAVAGTSLLFSSLVVFFLSKIATAISLPVQYDSIVWYSAGILAFDAMAIIPFAALRMERKTKKFALIKLVNIVSTVLLNILFLVVFRWGVEGIFLSALSASVLTFALLIPETVKHLEIRIHSKLLSSLLRFGLPSVPAGLAAMTMQVVDRPILRSLTDDAVVGVYQANYRLGIFMMLIVQMFDYAWRPFFFSTAKESDAKQIFARVLTYMVLGMSLVFLFLTFFIKDIVTLSLFGRHIIAPAYWEGLHIVPVILAGYVFLGISTNISAGFYIEKKTALVPVGTFIGAVINIAANYLLIPRLGMIGAAWATLFAYLAMTMTVYILVERIYPIHYEIGRLAKIAGGVLVTLILYAIIPKGNLIVFAVIKGGLIGLFLLLMYWMKFFNANELNIISGLVKRRSGNSPVNDMPHEEHGV